MTIGFIGAGNMGGALAAATAKTVGGAQVLLADLDSEKAARVAAAIGATADSGAAVAARSDYLFLGVKPQGMQAALSALRDTLAARATKPVLISMAAGLTVSCIRDWAGELPVIRIMPNTPVAVGAGMTLYTASGDVTAAQKAAFVAFMGASGRLCELPEEQIDAGCALSGCGPAFAYLFIEALAAGGEQKGLSSAEALTCAAQTVLGAARMVLETGKDPLALKDAVCSPGGATLAGVRALDEAGFRDVALGAVDAAYRRTLELKQ